MMRKKKKIKKEIKSVGIKKRMSPQYEIKKNNIKKCFPCGREIKSVKLDVIFY